MDIKVDDNTVIVFDLDDTLYNELEYLKSAYLEIAIYVNPENYIKTYVNMISLYRNGENVFEYVNAEFSVSFSKLIELYRNHIPNIQLFEGVLEFIIAIRNKGGKVAIITDGRERTQMAKINALGIAEYLEKIIISEVIGSEKPALANYKLIETEFPNCNYCYIADNLKKDFITPNKRRWLTIGLADNGLNVHFQASKFMTEGNIPQNFIMSYDQINVV